MKTIDNRNICIKNVPWDSAGTSVQNALYQKNISESNEATINEGEAALTTTGDNQNIFVETEVVECSNQDFHFTQSELGFNLSSQEYKDKKTSCYEYDEETNFYSQKCDHVIKNIIDLGNDSLMPVYPIKIENFSNENLCYKCDKCDFNSMYKSHLNEHSLKQCDKCHYRTKRKCSIQRHCLMHEVSKSIQFRSRAKKSFYFNQHEPIHENFTQMATLKCKLCQYVTKRKKLLSMHMRRHAMKAANSNRANARLLYPYKCEECNFTAKSKSDLKKHQPKHTDVRPFECSNCPYRAKTEVQLKNHQIKHKDILDVKTFSCTKCNFVTKYQRGLRRHESLHLDLSQVETFPCNMCNYVARTRTLLREHQFIHKDHSQMETLKCTNCNYVTKRQKLLIKHMRRHVKTNTNNDTVSVESENVIELDQNHSNESYKCKECTFTTKLKKYLRKHQIVHKDISQVKSFSCSKCKFVTKYSTSFKKHQLIHMDPNEIEIFSCDKCEYVTKFKSNLKGHQLLIHEDVSNIKMLKCNLCHYETRRKCLLTVHMRRHVTKKKMKPKGIANMSEAENNFNNSKEAMTISETTNESLNDNVPDFNEESLINGDSSKLDIKITDSIEINEDQKLSEAIDVTASSECGSQKAELLDSNNLIIFKQEKEINSNYKSETEQKNSKMNSLMCDRCSFVAKTMKTLKKHQIVHMDIKEVKTFNCSKCNFVTKYSTSFKKHQLIHLDPNEIEIFSCDKCEYVTKFKSNLKEHQWIHKDMSNIQILKCNFCHYVTKRKCLLTVHMRKHRMKKTSEPKAVAFNDVCSNMSENNSNNSITIWKKVLPHVQISYQMEFRCCNI